MLITEDEIWSNWSPTVLFGCYLEDDQLYCVDVFGVLKIWNWRTGIEEFIFDTETPCSAFSILPNKWVVVIAGSTFTLYSLERKKISHLYKGFESNFTEICILDENRIIFGSKDRKELIYTISDKMWAPNSLFFGNSKYISKFLNLIAVYSDLGFISIVNADNLEEKQTYELKTENRYSCSSLCLFGIDRVALGNNDGTIQIFFFKDSQFNEKLTLKGHDWRILKICGIDNRTIVSSSGKKICVWDVEIGECLDIRKFDVHWIRDISVSKDMIACISSRKVCIFRIVNLETLRSHVRDNTKLRRNLKRTRELLYSTVNSMRQSGLPPVPTLECCVCYEQKDFELTGCAHVVCSQCKIRIKKCPLCQESLTD